MAFGSFQSEAIQKSKKIGSVSAIAEHDGHLEGFLATPKSQITSFTPIINNCRSLREGLETLTFFNNHCCGFKEELETLTFFALTNNHCRNFRKRLENQISSFFTNNYCHSRNVYFIYLIL